MLDNSAIAAKPVAIMLGANIAGKVAAITESELGVESEITSDHSLG